jgi:hypothetical protein
MNIGKPNKELNGSNHLNKFEYYSPALNPHALQNTGVKAPNSIQRFNNSSSRFTFKRGLSMVV